VTVTAEVVGGGGEVALVAEAKGVEKEAGMGVSKAGQVVVVAVAGLREP